MVGLMVRAGGKTLSLLSVPLNVHLLKALEKDSQPLLDLRRAVGFPPQSTMRVYTRTLSEMGLIDRRRRNDFPTSADYQITASGQALLRVAAPLQEWLGRAPGGPILIGSAAAKNSIKALAEGWSTNIVRAISARPIPLTEMNQMIPQVNYPSLERRLGAMRWAGLVEPRPGDGRGMPYASTVWLREAVVPLAAAAAWEWKHLREAAMPIGHLDVEAAFLLAIPLMKLPADLTGRCRLVVEFENEPTTAMAGALVCMEEGVVVSCSSRLDGEAEGWVSGSPVAWLRQTSGYAKSQLELGGDVQLAEAVTDALHALASHDVHASS
jgi:DNA-binding HxlR family transcriptional regulator